MMTISPVDKKNFLLSLGARRLPGVTMEVAQVIVERINATLGVAFAHYSDELNPEHHLKTYAGLSGYHRRTVLRTIAGLSRDGTLKKRARRDGAPALWFPELMDMAPPEAVRRAEWLIQHRDDDDRAYFSGGAKAGTPSPPGGAKVGTSRGARIVTHNTVSNNLSLRESAPARLRAEEDRGTRLSRDWLPSKADRELAKRYGLNDSQIDNQATKFRNFWTSKPGKAALQLDWSGIWENWLITASEGRGLTQKAAVEPRPDPRTFTHGEWRRNCDVMLKNPGSKWPGDYWGPPPGDLNCVMPEPLQMELALVLKERGAA
jgi:hypothetical protein